MANISNLGDIPDHLEDSFWRSMAAALECMDAPERISQLLKDIREINAPKGKLYFLYQIPQHSRVLDVGCASYSAKYFKEHAPTIHYTGIDVVDWTESEFSHYADKLIFSPGSEFASSLEGLKGEFDVVVSAHNIEHCEERDRALTAICNCLKPSGQLYLSFPTEASVSFPRRKGTLNYYDDGSHVGTPPNFARVKDIIVQNGMRIDYEAKRYGMPKEFVIGLFNEKESSDAQELREGTWPFYGFETVIWATKDS